MLAGLDLGPGDEIADLRPTSTRGCSARCAARDAARGRGPRRCRSRELAEAVGPATRLVACSHVELGAPASSRPPRSRTLDVRCCSTARRASAPCRSTSRALGCAFYAGVRPEVAVRAGRHRHALGRAGVARARRPLGRDVPEPRGRRRAGSTPRRTPDARRYDAVGASRAEASAARARRARRARRRRLGRGPRARGARWPRRWRARLAERGRDGRPRAARRRSSRGRTPTRRPRSRGSPTAGVIVRDLPGTPYLRASVGAWNDERRPRAPARRARLSGEAVAGLILVVMS